MIFMVVEYQHSSLHCLLRVPPQFATQSGILALRNVTTPHRNAVNYNVTTFKALLIWRSFPSSNHSILSKPSLTHSNSFLNAGGSCGRCTCSPATRGQVTPIKVILRPVLKGIPEVSIKSGRSSARFCGQNGWRSLIPVTQQWSFKLLLWRPYIFLSNCCLVRDSADCALYAVPSDPPHWPACEPWRRRARPNGLCSLLLSSQTSLFIACHSYLLLTRLQSNKPMRWIY